MLVNGMIIFFHTLTQGFSTSESLTFGAGLFFIVHDAPVHCKVLSSIPALYPLVSSGVSPTFC